MIEDYLFTYISISEIASMLYQPIPERQPSYPSHKYNYKTNVLRLNTVQDKDGEFTTIGSSDYYLDMHSDYNRHYLLCYDVFTGTHYIIDIVLKQLCLYYVNRSSMEICDKNQKVLKKYDDDSEGIRFMFSRPVGPICHKYSMDTGYLLYSGHISVREISKMLHIEYPDLYNYYEFDSNTNRLMVMAVEVPEDKSTAICGIEYNLMMYPEYNKYLLFCFNSNHYDNKRSIDTYDIIDVASKTRHTFYVLNEERKIYVVDLEKINKFPVEETTTLIKSYVDGEEFNPVKFTFRWTSDLVI